MIVDTSAIIAIVFKEPGFEAILEQLTGESSLGVGTPTLVETGIVLAARLERDPVPLLMRLLQEFEITPIPFGPDHWREAVEAFLRYGKGRHPAGLNLGDCFSYAVARLADQPLLCVGADFPKTDLALA